MTRIILTTGELAKKPYRIRRMERNIWSVEELCYSLLQSAQFLDTDIMDPELVRWLDTECGLKELAEVLSHYLGHGRQLAEFVNTILEYTGYAPKETRASVRQTVSEGTGLLPVEKRIRNADYLAGSGRTHEALREYDAVLEALPGAEVQLRARTLQKEGRLYCGLFLFHMASEAFYSAYELTHDPENYLYYLTAVRLELPQEEYVRFISEHPEAYEYSLTLEQRMEEAEKGYASSTFGKEAAKLKEYLDGDRMTSFEVELGRVVGELKQSYRLSRATAF